MDPEGAGLQAGKLHRLPSGEWYVRCRHCDWDERLPICDQKEAKDQLYLWRRSLKGRSSRKRNYSCPSCRTWWDKEPKTTETAETAATDAAGSAGQLADQRMQRASFDALQLEVVALKADVVELKKEVERLKAEAHEHVAYQAPHDEEFLARALQMVRREGRRRAVPDDTTVAADIAVPDEPEETSLEC